MPGLAAERCEACVPGMAPLGSAAAGELRATLDEAWSVDDGIRLRRRWKFPNFAAAFAFTTHVALICEQEGHHADLRVGWGYAEVDLTTHAAKGLTRNDFIVAAKVDKIQPPVMT